MTRFPNPDGTRLQNFVGTMLAHGNTPENLDLETLARFNPWSADEMLVEFHLQQNGSRKLPEEVAATEPPPSEPVEEVDE